MSERKGTTVLLTVIGIATLLVTLVGATFAWFSAQVEDTNPNNTDVTITAANLGKITFAHGDTILLENVLPGVSDEVEFTVASPSDATAPVDYEIFMVVSANTFTSNNLVGTLTAESGNTAKMSSLLSNSALNTTTYPVNNTDTNSDGQPDGVKIGSGQVEAGSTDTWTLNVSLPETGGDQNADQGKSFTAKLVVRATTTYTQDSVYGG